MALVKGMLGATLLLAIVWSASAVGTLSTTASSTSSSTSDQQNDSVSAFTTSAPSKVTTNAPTTAAPTTAAPTTAAPPVSTSTTVAPATSTVPPATSTATPDVPKEYYWNVTDGKGVNCILAKAEIKLELTYINQTTKKDEVHEDFSIPSNATSAGSCDEQFQTLRLSFNDNSTIAFTFMKDNATKGYHLTNISSNVTLAKENVTVALNSKDVDAFETQFNTSYECSWSQPAVLREQDAGQNSTKATLRVVLTNIRVEAFRNSTDDHFSKVYSCSMDSPDIVPIMVGIALGILVVVVMIAYLVGRRTSQAQGYLSM